MSTIKLALETKNNMPIPQDKAAFLLENQLQLIQNVQELILRYMQRTEILQVEDMLQFAEAINIFTVGYDKILFGDIDMFTGEEKQFIKDLIRNSNETKAKLAALEASNAETSRLLAIALEDDAIDEQLKTELQTQLNESNRIIAELQAQTEEIRQEIIAEQNETGGVVQPTPIEPTPAEPIV